MQEFEHAAVPDELKDTAEAIVWAEHIVFVFPLWLGTMPAMLKAFLEQVMRPGRPCIPGQGRRLHQAWFAAALHASCNQSIFSHLPIVIAGVSLSASLPSV